MRMVVMLSDGLYNGCNTSSSLLFMCTYLLHVFQGGV
jgi:hypothetical protein